MEAVSGVRRMPETGRGEAGKEWCRTDTAQLVADDEADRLHVDAARNRVGRCRTGRKQRLGDSRP